MKKAYKSNDRSIMTTKLSEAINTGLFGSPPLPEKMIALPPAGKLLSELEGICLNTRDHSMYLKVTEKEGRLWSGSDSVRFLKDNRLRIGNMICEIKANGLMATSAEGEAFYQKVEKPGANALADLSGIFGEYTSPDANITFTISKDGDQLFASRSDYDRIALSPLFNIGDTAVFRGMTNGLRALFYFAPNGNRFSLTVSLPRAAEIPFGNKK